MTNRDNYSGASRISDPTQSQPSTQLKKPKWVWGTLATVALFGFIFVIAWISGPMSDQEMAEREIDLCWGTRSNNPVHDEVKGITKFTCHEMVKKYEAIYGKSSGMRHE